MRRRTLRKAIGVAGAIVIGLGLAACGSGDREPSPTVSVPTGQAMAPSTPPTTPPATATASASASAVSQSKASTVPTPTGSGAATGSSRPHPPRRSAPGCTSGQLAVRVIHQQATRAGASPAALLTFTNTSRHSCSLDGWPAVALTNAADDPVVVQTTRVHKARRPIPVTVRPNRTAFAGLEWTACEKPAATCAVGNALRVTPPGASTPATTQLIHFPPAAASGITMRSMRISPVQMTIVGAIGW